jgi:predicted metal-dependent hydrolase
VARTAVLAGREITYLVVRSRRRRRTFEIRIDPGRGLVVSVPWRTPEAEVVKLVEQRAAWILGWIDRPRRVEAPDAEPLALNTGASIPYLGQELKLVVEQGVERRPRVALRPSEEADAGGIVVMMPGSTASPTEGEVWAALEGWYRQQAAEAFAESVAFWAPGVGAEPSRVLVRAQKRLWGSCAADGTVRLNWRLVQLDPSLIDYVVVHELAHLRVRNHSARFWNEVRRVLPDYAQRRARLRASAVLIR